MLYLDVLQDICAQLNDPDMVSLKERAKDHFVRALSYLINEGNFTESDIPGYYKSTDITPDVKGEASIDAYKVLKIVNYVYSVGTASSVGSEVLITPKTLEQLSRINATPSLQPTKYDLFIVRQGNLLRCFVGPLNANFKFNQDKFEMIYIEDINNSSWNDAPSVLEGGTDFQSAIDYKFSFSFTRRAIERAVLTLLAEDKE